MLTKARELTGQTKKHLPPMRTITTSELNKIAAYAQNLGILTMSEGDWYCDGDDRLFHYYIGSRVDLQQMLKFEVVRAYAQTLLETEVEMVVAPLYYAEDGLYLIIRPTENVEQPKKADNPEPYQIPCMGDVMGDLDALLALKRAMER